MNKILFWLAIPAALVAATGASLAGFNLVFPYTAAGKQIVLNTEMAQAALTAVERVRYDTMLEVIRTKGWESMSVDDRVRFCGYIERLGFANSYCG